MIPNYTLPSDRNTILARIDLKSKCVHCAARLVKLEAGKPKNLRFRADVNGLNELIAWCSCRKCRKISPLRLK